MADTTLRLWHVGSNRFSWEDAGRDVERFADYTFHLHIADQALSPAAEGCRRFRFEQDNAEAKPPY